jgi:hypothetical protein
LHLVEDLVAEKPAPMVQPTTTVADQSMDDRVRRLERILKSF